MPAVHFTSLLIVVAAAFIAPLALGFFPRLRVPSIVPEILISADRALSRVEHRTSPS